MNAIRTVEETPDTRTVEGLLSFSGQDRGRDSYGTRFSARTDWGLDLHPQGIPVLFEHGFDPDFGLKPIGFTAPTASFRTDADGVWVRMQLDKRHAYYETRIKPLLDEGALGVSQGSAEHSVRIARDGEVLAWPLHEVSLTPTNSNWFNTIAARTADVVRIIAARATDAEGKAEGSPVGGKDRADIPDEDFAGPDKSFPIVDQASVDSAAKLIGHADDPDAVKAKIIAIAKRKGLDIPDAWQETARSALRKILTFADIEASAEMDEELPEAFQTLQSAIYSAIWATDKDFQPVTLDEKKAAIGQSLDEFRDCVLGILDRTTRSGSGLLGTPLAFRAGRRNSTADQAHVDAIHDHAAALGASAHAGDEPPDDESHEASDADDAARSAEALPGLRIVGAPERADAAAIRAQILERAATLGTEAARSLTS